MGLLRAYGRTVLMVIFRPKLFCEQLDNPIILKEARLFWMLTICLAYLPLVGGAVQIYYTESQPNSIHRAIQSLFIPNYQPLPIGVFYLFGLLLFILFATGMPSYFCHPSSITVTRQNRAIALSYFACAPLALMPFIIALLLLAQLFWRLDAIALTFQISAALLAIFMLGCWHVRTTGIVLSVSQRSNRNQTVLTLIITWVFLMMIFLFTVPIALWYVWLTLRILF